ncbi:velvet factor-domain-containing protein [Cokeromyces recurvatus]|uniref:velvet factor-domain-containing protein n=1 Tax=Cokeromyces recurvatus TaxID=90255 RepID=UPI00222054C5|nr:velvet factor-domain-containing protein [Cokeromyces recurvatus]KAI7898727.1 velvet factor-domain-containing protein [Cokeromyces recurvatus]
MCVTLIDSNTHEEIINTVNQNNILSGQTSSSMYKLKDVNNHDGGFFVFGDLSVKLEGQFKLKFSMFEISKTGVTNLKSIYSNIFQVYSSKTFPGVLESTFLSRSFSDQGVRIRIRKEHRVQMYLFRMLTHTHTPLYK